MNTYVGNDMKYIVSTQMQIAKDLEDKFDKTTIATHSFRLKKYKANCVLSYHKVNDKEFYHLSISFVNSIKPLEFNERNANKIVDAFKEYGKLSVTKSYDNRFRLPDSPELRHYEMEYSN